jgi:hypothetical protein
MNVRQMAVISEHKRELWQQSIDTYASVGIAAWYIADIIYQAVS